MDRKTIIAFSFATNRLGAGLVGLVYYNPEIHSDNYNHINIPKLGHYVHEYNLKDTGSVSHRSTFRNETPATNGGNTSSNNTIIMNYTLYRGNNNVTGELLNVYVNGKLEHRSLLINSTELNNNFTVVPLYSKSGNYNVTVLNTNATNNTKNATGNNPNVYVDLQAIYSLGSGGEALAFNQEMTDTLLYVLGVGVAIAGVAALVTFAASVIVAAILSIGIGTILLYDEFGGGNGVFFFVHTGIFKYAWINSPYNQVPNDYKNYGSCPITLYNGDLQ
ncbi:MAG: hypothetical protein AMDU4_FER2C00293G0001 [Ferroplasma sp. Type II]|uniref:hypothetical protein n=1 Tax=Ferroplasma sp. Type II TaxID=261388 RepID=UPI000389513C|nr:hypothetical protein [Ferroplasma sp. Type II]EQB69022.1 MAG: hypothetical protein AMDU4_FER2C00293G0001 [Ferroplasma sp. Type II]